MSVWLSFAGGLTIFQALVVPFSNSYLEFMTAFSENTDHKAKETSTGQAWLTTTGCFGVGIVFNYCVDLFVKQLTPQGQRQSLFARCTRVTRSKSHLRLGSQTSRTHAKSSLVANGRVHKGEAAALGVLNIVAISVHNIPGGVATMVASSEHTFIGLALAIGVGLHKVAEGIVVATPVFFATGSKWKRSHVVSGGVHRTTSRRLLGFWYNGQGRRQLSQGVLYGLVSGMLTCISMKNIFPTAYTYANKRIHLVSSGGMVFMAASLILFKYMGV